ncbi:hypothetical protein VNO78_19035 [Psophocarpus tetragonolobus]|uniref:Uncharacterized protein n=1 Tax=Psophocarpus tetragonolobus TaxID=3891 RepID=A0AAN9S936_PSOTE
MLKHYVKPKLVQIETRLEAQVEVVNVNLSHSPLRYTCKAHRKHRILKPKPRIIAFPLKTLMIRLTDS